MKDETISYIINVNLAQKEEQTRHKRERKLVNSKKFKFEYTNKSYIHNPKSVPENATYKILLEF